MSWLVIQELIYIEKFGFRVPILSILRGTHSLKGVIRENKIHQIENILQLGKNEGMFTMDRYLNDYLMTQMRLVPPVKIFRPSLKSGEEIVYHSPVMDSSPEQPQNEVRERKRSPGPISPSPVDDQPATFSPSEKSLKAFIEELDKQYK